MILTPEEEAATLTATYLSNDGWGEVLPDGSWSL